MSGPEFDPAGTIDRLDQMRAALSDLKLWLVRGGQFDQSVYDAVDDAKDALAIVADLIESETTA